jgi:hypothetical protein
MARRSKSKSEKAHALRRCRERYGISLTDNDYEVLCRQIKENKAKLVERQSNRLTVWEIQLCEEQVRVCYDGSRGKIVTFLPPPGSWFHHEVDNA